MITAARERAIQRRLDAAVRRQIAESTSIRELWLLYRAAILPRDADEAERDAYTRSFYTGAAAALELLGRFAASPDAEASVAQIMGLRQELDRFAADLKGGRV